MRLLKLARGTGPLLRAVCVIALAAWASGLARADANTAAAAYFRNLERLNYDTAARATTTARGDTLVQGVYRLEDTATGRLIALITERGDLKGDSSGWSRVGPDGPVGLTEIEAAQLRAEVMRSVAWDRLIPVRYGDGGGRHLILISAVNCPYCQRMEANLAKWAASLNTTFYVLPSSLTPLDVDGADQRTWRQATALWCAADAGASWKRFWATHQVPSTPRCALEPAAAQRLFHNFGTVMASIGAKVRGTPALIREDGVNFGVPPDFDRDYAVSTYGPAGLPPKAAPHDPNAAFVWLTAAPK